MNVFRNRINRLVPLILYKRIAHGRSVGLCEIQSSDIGFTIYIQPDWPAVHSSGYTGAWRV